MPAEGDAALDALLCDLRIVHSDIAQMNFVAERLCLLNGAEDLRARERRLAVEGETFLHAVLLAAENLLARFELNACASPIVAEFVDKLVRIEPNAQIFLVFLAVIEGALPRAVDAREDGQFLVTFMRHHFFLPLRKEKIIDRDVEIALILGVRFLDQRPKLGSGKHFSVADERLRRHFDRFDPRHKHLPTVIVYTKIGALSTSMGAQILSDRISPAACKR